MATGDIVAGDDGAYGDNGGFDSGEDTGGVPSGVAEGSLNDMAVKVSCRVMRLKVFQAYCLA